MSSANSSRARPCDAPMSSSPRSPKTRPPQPGCAACSAVKHQPPGGNVPARATTSRRSRSQRRTSGRRSDRPGRPRTRCATGGRGRCSGRPYHRRGELAAAGVSGSKASLLGSRGTLPETGAIGVLPDVADLHVRRRGRVGRSGERLFGGGATGESPRTPEIAPAVGEPKSKSTKQHVAALQGSPVGRCRSPSPKRPVPPLSEVGDDDHRELILAVSCRAASIMSSSRSTSLASTLAVPVGLRTSSTRSPQLGSHYLESSPSSCSPVSFVPRSRSWSNRCSASARSCRALSSRADAAVGDDSVTLAAATSASMTRSVWVPGWQPSGSNRPRHAGEQPGLLPHRARAHPSTVIRRCSRMGAKSGRRDR